jgi:Asp-tRNA(Asn)/Glu-tRNA(Gln) amidotransferase A subunit family amidase
VKTPTSITFTGKLFGEVDLLTIAHEFQQATGHHLERPDLARLVEPEEIEE